jgi:hypothetical protein
MGIAHQNQKKTAQPKSETNALAIRKKVNSYQQKANSSYTKQYSNPYGPVEFS